MCFYSVYNNRIRNVTKIMNYNLATTVEIRITFVCIPTVFLGCYPKEVTKQKKKKKISKSDISMHN